MKSLSVKHLHSKARGEADKARFKEVHFRALVIFLEYLRQVEERVHFYKAVKIDFNPKRANKTKHEIYVVT